MINVRFQFNRERPPGEESGRDPSGCGRARPLPDYPKGAEVTALVNRDRKTLEMGLRAGAKIRILENRPGDANLAIAVGDSRYILAKATAAHIRAR